MKLKKEYEYMEEHILKLRNIPNTKEVHLNSEVPSKRNIMEKGLQQNRLRSFFPIPDLFTVVKYNFIEGKHMNSTHCHLINKFSEFKTAGITKGNYFDVMRFMLHIEECHITNQIQKFDQDNVTFLRKGDRLFCPIDENMAQSQFLDEWISVLLISKSNQKEYDAEFVRIKNKILELEIDSMIGFNHHTKYKMEFKINRRCFQIEHNALRVMENTQWLSYLFPNKAVSCSNYLNFSYDWYNKL